MKYSYFPGCSLKGLGRAYEESLLPVMKHLGVELQELEDWNCCGATAYMAVDEAKACVLAARNLALAEKQGDLPMMAPCAACYLVLNKTKHYFHDYPAMKETIDRALGSGWAALQRQHPRAPPARHADQRRRPGGASKQKVQQATEGPEGRSLLRLPARPALRDVRRPVQSDHDGPAAGGARGHSASATRSRPNAAAAASPARCPRRASAWCISS